MNIPHIGIDELATVLAAGARLHDAREPQEYLRSNGLDTRNVSGGTNPWIKSGRPSLSGRSSI